ncbi:MAG: dUTP diphosphatase [Candidatus Brocadiia bacterium]
MTAQDRIQVAIKRKPGTEDIALPAYMSEHASGMDLRAAVEAPVVIQPGEVRLVPTGIYIAVPPGYEAQVRPRSGLALKNGVFVVNTPGTIDADYRGEVGIILGNIGRQPFTIERGARIAQLVIQRVARAEWQLADSLPETARSDGGFGHTGT